MSTLPHVQGILPMAKVLVPPIIKVPPVPNSVILRTEPLTCDSLGDTKNTNYSTQEKK